MPKLSVSNLPPALEKHLLQRIGQRMTAVQDLLALATWINSSPTVPESEWYRDFGSFKLAGEGCYMKTILEPHMYANGSRVK